MPDKRLSFMTAQRTAVLQLLVLAVIMAGCSNSKLRRTPEAERKTPWFCQMNESRDNWECVQDAELARHPKPERLPSDEPEVPSSKPAPTIDPELRIDPQTPPLASPG